MQDDVLRSALVKMQEGADDQQDVALSWIECRVLLSEFDALRSTVAITTSQGFRSRVKRYRKTGVV